MAAPDLLILTPYLDPPPGGVQRLALDIFAAHADTNVRLLAVSGEPRDDPRIRIVPLREGRVGSVVTAAAYALATFSELRRRPKFVHAMTWRSAVPLLVLRKTPTALYTYGAELIRNWGGPLEVAVRKRVLARITGLVGCSHFAAKVTLERTGRNAAVVLPTLQSVPELAPRAARSDAPVRVFSVGRLVDDKGMDRLLRALAAIRAQGVDMIVRIAGVGPRMDSLRAQISELGLEQHATLLGRISDEQLAQEYAAADIFALLSCEANDEVEGFGIVYIEAASHGLPVVAGGVGGIPDAVADGINGYLTRTHDEEVNALLTLARDPVLRRKFGDAGRARVEAEFLLPQFRAALDKFYAQCRAAKTAGTRL